MKTIPKFKKFNSVKSVDELFYNTALWTYDLEFISTELSFLQKLIESYPFKNVVMNLFERIQLFVEEIKTLKKGTNSILDTIHKYENQLNGMLECNDLSCDNFYVVENQELAESVFDFIQKYRRFKTEVYEYIKGII